MVDTAHVLVRAFIHSRLDYCNVVRWLPCRSADAVALYVLRAATRLAWPCFSLSSHAQLVTLALSYPQRVTYKLCLLTYKAGRPSTFLDFVCRQPLSRVVLGSVRLMTTASRAECRQLRLVPSVLHIWT